ncbi:phosphatase PAP2 family protein [Streptomyces sp. NPDC001515]
MTALAFTAPSIDGGLYTRVTELARHSPGPLDAAVRLWTDYGLAVFAVLMLVSWWRSRSGDPARTAAALCAPLVVVAAFLVNDVVKSLVQEQRPCRTLQVLTVEACPPLGDWSFPSNHTTVAAAAATAIWLADRRLGALAWAAALLMGASRVWVGAHYPHDVAVALLVGLLTAWPLTAAARRCAPAVERLRSGPLRPLVAVDR